MDKNNLVTQTILKICFLMLLCLACPSTSDAQISQPQDEPFDALEGIAKCNDWHTYIGDAVRRWGGNKNASFIIIARLGDGETSRRLNLKRIKALKNYILKPEYKIKAVFAEGEPIKGFGTVEFYVEGKLLYSLHLDRNNSMGLGFCPS